VDTRDTPEQAELRRSARQLARELGPATVADLDDLTRAKRLAVAVRDAGWLELRDDAGTGAPLASGVEAAVVADALGGSVADVAFAGPLLAADLARRAGVPAPDGRVVGFSSDLIESARVTGSVTTAPFHAVDCADEPVDGVYALVIEPGGYGLAVVPVDNGASVSGSGADLTRAVRRVAPGTSVAPVAGQGRLLTDDDLAAWTALGLALTSADLVGNMRGVLDVTVEYATERRQYAVPVGSFQAVQHLLAEAHCLMEGSHSVALHASWAVDNLAPDAALAAGRVAKAYCARAARTVCETAVQVHGGIGNTWECIVHVYLRRALLSSMWFGDDGAQLLALQRSRLGVPDGLS
jgi:alkylation response protein AidB-like acyl-CoA dehydrogenase